MTRGLTVGLLLALAAAGWAARPWPASAQTPRPAPAPRPGPAAAPRSQPAHPHGTPPGWQFTWPAGDAARGRAVFVKLSCYSCHEVKGEDFPIPTDRRSVGPELSQMARSHEPAYFAEAIINPGAQVEKGQGYEAADGSSKMPSYNDSVTVQEVADLVAYLRALKPSPAAPARRSSPSGPPAAQPAGRSPSGHQTH